MGEGSFFDKYFNVNLSDYPAFGTNLNVSLLVFGIFLGLCAAVIILTYLKSGTALVLRQLIRHGATDEQSAKTATELGLITRKTALRALASDKALRRIVALVGEEAPTYEEYTDMTTEERERFERRSDIDFESARFFIKEGCAERAMRRIQSDTSSPITAAFLCLLLLGAFILLSLVLPSLLSFAASLIS